MILRDILCVFLALTTLLYSKPTTDLVTKDIVANDRLLKKLKDPYIAEHPWGYSKSGGYILAYESDLIGNEEEELLVGYTVFHNTNWDIYSLQNGEYKYVDSLIQAGLTPISGLKKNEQTILQSPYYDNYDNPPFKKLTHYISEKIISKNGISKRFREVGLTATQKEYDDLRFNRSHNIEHKKRLFVSSA